MFEINKVKLYMEQLPKYNFEDINGFFLHFYVQMAKLRKMSKLKSKNSVDISPKRLLKYILNIVANSELKIPKVPKSSVSKAKKNCDFFLIVKQVMQLFKPLSKKCSLMLFEKQHL